eukprot:TRINITY_DN14648_c0_g1_i1.p1 TRINITY_DN14648_c0_g1~~TRINITY_DN14648_c0_g1_i1.p1  ORF type:complete len:327 (+),score=61.18 TRINITY_DN14648_c0_g1_i1:79-1059(+)
MSNGSEECTWVPSGEKWSWQGGAASAEVVTAVEEPKVLCLGDGIFSSLVHNGRFSDLLQSLGLVTATVSSITEALGLAETADMDDWCAPSVHTIVLCLGAFDVKRKTAEQVRDGILQIAETIAKSSNERVERDDDALPQQIIIYGVPPTDASFSAEEAVQTTAKVNSMLSFETLEKYPYLASLKMQRMLSLDCGLYNQLNVKEELHHREVSLNSRGIGVLVQKLIDDVLPKWPGGNPPVGIFEGMKQLGLKGEQKYFPFTVTSAAMQRKFADQKSSQANAIPSSKSWATIAATQRSHNAASKLDSVTNFSRLRGMRTVLRAHATPV